MPPVESPQSSLSELVLKRLDEMEKKAARGGKVILPV